MRRSRIIFMAVVFLVVAAGALAALLNPDVQQWIFDRGAASMIARVNTALLADDALRVAICVSSAPLPSPPRAKACVAVFAAGNSISWMSGRSRLRTWSSGAYRFQRSAGF